MELKSKKTMKPEELQIGDWVYWKGKPVQIAQISGIKYSFGHIDVVLAHCNDDNILESHDIKSIKPIPITPEILKLNGFSLLEQTRTYRVFTLREEDELSIQVDFFGKDSRIIVRIEKYNYESRYYMNCLHNCDIKYVHQLQQAMRLCGIDKEITLI